MADRPRERLRITDYERPPVEGFDPDDAARLWKLIVRFADIRHDELLTALQAQGVRITKTRIKRWMAGAGDENRSPINVAEIERNLRALIAQDRADK